MPSLFVHRDGTQSIPVTVLLPRTLRDYAKENGISMSKTLKIALETKMEECQRVNATNTHSLTLSNTDEQVDK